VAAAAQPWSQGEEETRGDEEEETSQSCEAVSRESSCCAHYRVFEHTLVNLAARVLAVTHLEERAQLHQPVRRVLTQALLLVAVGKQNLPLQLGTAEQSRAEN
jgi:hypothetical protein